MHCRYPELCPGPCLVGDWIFGVCLFKIPKENGYLFPLHDSPHLFNLFRTKEFAARSLLGGCREHWDSFVPDLFSWIAIQTFVFSCSQDDARVADSLPFGISFIPGSLGNWEADFLRFFP